MSKKHSFVRYVPGPSRLAAAFHGVVGLLALMGASVSAAPLFLGLADGHEDVAPLLVMAGQPVELVIRVADSAAVELQLSLDLVAVIGKTATPLFSGVTPAVKRVGEVKGGLQRFQFTLEVPAVDRKQSLLLRLRARTEGKQPWLPLPPVRLEATPLTWKESLRQFARQLPSGRLDNDERLEKIFAAAEVEALMAAPGATSMPTAVRVWFAAAPAGDLALAATPAGTIWILFKKGAGAGRVQRLPADGSFAVLADDMALEVSGDKDAPAQALFENALNQALALTHSSP